jgi:hypothetical protein
MCININIRMSFEPTFSNYLNFQMWEMNFFWILIVDNQQTLVWTFDQILFTIQTNDLKSLVVWKFSKNQNQFYFENFQKHVIFFFNLKKLETKTSNKFKKILEHWFGLWTHNFGFLVQEGYHSSWMTNNNKSM